MNHIKECRAYIFLRLAVLHLRLVWGLVKARIKPNLLVMDTVLIEHLLEGWNNDNWPAHPEMLREICDIASSSRGAVIECGSGLSTVVLGIITRASGQQVWSLENDCAWLKRVDRCLRMLRLNNVHLLHAPLCRFDSLDWYDISGLHLPKSFSLVIVDGPPSGTRGGRSGARLFLGEHLASPCTVIIDDTDRNDERRLFENWSEDLNADGELRDSAGDFGIIWVK